MMNTHVRDNLNALKVALIPGGTIQMVWSTLGGTSNKNPVVSGTTYSDWYLCDGGTYNGYATPDFRDRFIVGAGNSYSQGDTGGSDTADHIHGPGTLATDTVASHSHAINAETDNDYAYGATGGDAWGPFSNASHNHDGYTVGAGSHSHDVDSGATASAAPDNRPKYIAGYWFMYCPA